MIMQGDALTVLKGLEDHCVQCCVTSPPYWGLRDYGVVGQLGLEKTPEEYVSRMVEVFREVRRVLRDDGTLWLNLGDSYAGGGNYRGINSENTLAPKQASNRGARGVCQELGAAGKETGCKPKDIIGIPWLVAFALRADGWVLRQEIIWSKSNPMPESVTDRCTKSHESIFLFAKATWSGPQPRRFSRISKEDARWLALFLDAEGNICAKRAKASSGTDHFGLQICFANTSRALLDRAREIIGDGTVLERPGKNSPMFYYQLSNRQAADLLYELYPHLIIKARQAALGIHLQSLIAESDHERRTKEGRKRGRLRDDDYTEELIKIWATMKALNHFGNPDLSWVAKPEYGHWSRCARYYYDQDAILEPVSANTHMRLSQDLAAQVGSYRANGGTKANGAMKAVGRKPAASWNGSTFDGPRDLVVRPNTGRKMADSGSGIKNNDSFNESVCLLVEKRNKRSVWTVPTTPYSEAHFATFPPDLIKPCILAGTKSGDIVLDPFFGSGTTGMVALELGRDYIGIELNEKYCELARARCNVTPGLKL